MKTTEVSNLTPIEIDHLPLRELARLGAVRACRDAISTAVSNGDVRYALEKLYDAAFEDGYSHSESGGERE
jgi:hypothetical protein